MLRCAPTSQAFKAFPPQQKMKINFVPDPIIEDPAKGVRAIADACFAKPLSRGLINKSQNTGCE